MRQSGVGLGLAVVSAATFGSSGPFASALLRTGWSPGSAVLIRIGLAALALTVPALLALRGRWNLLRRDAVPTLAYGLAAVGVAQLCFFMALEHLSVAVALLLEYSGTLLVVLWMWLRHHERPRRLTVGGGALALVGLAFVLDLTGDQRVDLTGVLWGLGAAVGLAAYFLLSASERTEGQALPAIAMAWAGMVVAALSLAAAGVIGVLPLHATTNDVAFRSVQLNWIIPVIGLGLVAGATAYSTGILAARRLGARLASFVGLTEVLAAALFAWALLGQRPGLLQAVGGLLVLAGIALVRADDRVPESSSVELPVLEAEHATSDQPATDVGCNNAATSGQRRRRSARALGRRLHKSSRGHDPDHRARGHDADRPGRGAGVDPDAVPTACR